MNMPIMDMTSELGCERDGASFECVARILISLIIFFLSKSIFHLMFILDPSERND